MNEQVLKNSKLRKTFLGGWHPPPPPPPFIRPRVNRKKKSTTSMNSHPKHTEIHRKSIFFTYFIDQKAKYDDIYCLQNSVFYFSYNVSTVACNAIPTRLRNRGGGETRPLKSMISRQITQKHIKRKSTLFSLLIKRYQKSLFIVRRPQYQFISHTWPKLMIELRYRLSEISQENLGIFRELLRNIPENFREILSHIWDFFGNRNGLRILGNS